jgi:6-phosphogluconolactonase (cycloisomerase 2 family)
VGPIKNICVVGACAVGGLALPPPVQAAPTEAYVSSDANPGRVSEFTIDLGGQLTPNGFAPAVGKQTLYEAVTPNGRYLYAINDESSGTVAQYRITSNGTLNALTPATVAALPYPQGIAVSPDGKYAYVAGGNKKVSIFNVAANGKLSPNAAQPTETTNLSAQGGLAVSPDGRSLYVTANKTVAEFNVAGAGRLTPKATPRVAAGSYAQYVVITPNGEFVYAVNWGASSISEYRVGAGGELLHNGTTAGVGVIGDDLISATISPDGKSLYAANDGAIYQFNIGPTGVLTPKSPANVTAGPGASNLWFAADGTSAYAANYASGPSATVSEWNVGPNGGLEPKSTPTVASGPGTIAVMIAPDQGPVAAFLDTPAYAGSPTHFNASASHDTDGLVVRYAWRFGDGTSAQSAAPTTSHTYAKPGHYTVSLTVTDDSGCSSRFVFTGVTAYCHGGPAARLERAIAIIAKPAAAAAGFTG